MKKKRLSNQLKLNQQNFEDKKFKRILLISFSFLFLGLISILTFYTYRCQTEYAWRKIALYGKEVQVKLVCMNTDNLQIHESTKGVFKDKVYYFCSQHCYNHLLKHFNEVALVPDAFSGDTINKTEAIIGLKKRHNSDLVYFKNKKNFNQYYDTKNEK